MDRSQSDFIELCFWKDIQKETVWRSGETFSLLYDQTCLQNFYETDHDKNNVFLLVAHASCRYECAMSRNSK